MKITMQELEEMLKHGEEESARRVAQLGWQHLILVPCGDCVMTTGGLSDVGTRQMVAVSQEITRLTLSPIVCCSMAPHAIASASAIADTPGWWVSPTQALGDHFGLEAADPWQVLLDVRRLAYVSRSAVLVCHNETLRRLLDYCLSLTEIQPGNRTIYDVQPSEAALINAITGDVALLSQTR